jgi:hypothetical protein
MERTLAVPSPRNLASDGCRRGRIGHWVRRRLARQSGLWQVADVSRGQRGPKYHGRRRRHGDHPHQLAPATPLPTWLVLTQGSADVGWGSWILSLTTGVPGTVSHGWARASPARRGLCRAPTARCAGCETDVGTSEAAASRAHACSSWSVEAGSTPCCLRRWVPRPPSSTSLAARWPPSVSWRDAPACRSAASSETCAIRFSASVSLSSSIGQPGST